MSSLNMLALDLGASGGRAMLGAFDGSRLTMNEVYRFSNEPVSLGNCFLWDFLRLFHEVKQSIGKAGLYSGPEISSLAIDTWGVDVGFIDWGGRLLGNPHHYRDPRTENIPEEVYQFLPKDELYRMTGNYPWQYNTIFQLYATKSQEAALFKQASGMLFMPDLINYFLTGEKATEYTVASTSGMLDATTGDWSREVLDRLAFPESLFAEIRQPGTVLAPLQDKVSAEINVRPVSVVLTASHDSASAVAAIPVSFSRYAYISCGTWSIVGIENGKQINSPLSQRLSFTNEGSLDNKTRVLKNIMGLWLLQECRKQWANEGEPLSYQSMQNLARTISNSNCYIDPDDNLFLLPSHMPDAIRLFCQRTNQPIPQSKAEIIRCVVESMALKYRKTIEELELLLPNKIEIIHMLGGGVNNHLLCQLTANAVGKPVVAGPVEATVMGNLLVQAMAHGEILNLNELRQVVKNSFSPLTYEPQSKEEWGSKYERYKKLAER
ncbi:L-fuculose kinase [Paenibacillus baekrokdamisoli]|uniref:L-fuculose kinase n=1 Tax=Paenibacillus baekrokdamisoli TaxID=1712516 RepID=A0A3G9JJA0_9BACL|nr:rhamnulokinase family protein [Paenibacillus baekrokdamisoli]MBB3067898.1 sugar (pentulose or hexulose) kinase [Paenibacillus baekrokdamisoli]BBH23054.1 L-fuculose kinase [Paenibacillus baekrokdamisoli]